MTRSRSILARGGFGVVALLAGCTQTLDFVQCRDDRDCRNAEGLDLVCSADHTCEPALSPPEFACESGLECREAFGPDHVCGPQGTCANLRSAACTELWTPSGADPDAIPYLAAILPTGDLRRASQLAAATLANVGWIGCTNDPNGRESATTVDALLEAGVQAFVAGETTEEMIAVSGRTIAAGALLITPLAKGISIGTHADANLVWRTVASDRLEAAAIAHRVAELAPDPPQVLVFAPNDFTGRLVREAVSTDLHAAMPQVNEAVLLYPPASTFPTPEERLAAYAIAAEQGLAHRPEVVVLLGGYETNELILLLLQARDEADPRPPLPRFVVARDAGPFLPFLGEAVDPSFRDSLLSVVEAVTPRWTTPERYAAFQAAASRLFGNASPSQPAALAYDATLLAALAVVANGTPSPRGHDLAAQLPRLVQADAELLDFALDPEAVRKARERLGQGQTFQAVGFSGPLWFDASSGDRWSDFSGWDLRSTTTDPPRAVLREARLYTVEPPPAIAGIWSELP